MAEQEQDKQNKGSSGEAWRVLGAIASVIVYFVYFKEEPKGIFSGFGMPTLFAVGGYILFALLGAIFHSAKKQ